MVSFSIPLISTEVLGSAFFHEIWFILPYTLLGGYLMVSSVPLLSYKIGSADRFLNQLRLGSLFLYAICLAFFHIFGVFLCLLMYLVISLTVHKRFRKNDIRS
jgi:phosphatidylserine synthase